MLKTFVLPAILTGVFCAGFAVLIDTLTDMLEQRQVIMFSFLSGFTGSIVARIVLAKWNSQ